MLLQDDKSVVGGVLFFLHHTVLWKTIYNQIARPSYVDCSGLVHIKAEIKAFCGHDWKLSSMVQENKKKRKVAGS